jgi:hypothetical protein
MKQPATIASMVLISLTAFAVQPAPEPRGCEGLDCKSLVPIDWPLGLERFKPRRLLYSHGQFEQHDTDAANVHRGIDIAGEEGEYVYAIQEGVVDIRYDDGGAGYGYLYVRDAELPAGSPTMGWKYMHMKNFKVKPEDPVLRDQVLGELVKFPKAQCFDHLHLQRITGNSPLDYGSEDAGNPLPLLPSRADGIPPLRRSFESPIPPAVGFLFYDDGAYTSVGSPPTAGAAVDIVARVAENFPGAYSPSCSAAPCALPVGPPDLAPMRLSLSIFQEASQSSSGGTPARTMLKKVFTNTIDLRVAIENSAAGALLQGNIYAEGSRGDYDDRYLLVIMTNCQESGTGSFTFAAQSSYLLQLLLEDASGNATPFERTIDIP